MSESGELDFSSAIEQMERLQELALKLKTTLEDTARNGANASNPKGGGKTWDYDSIDRYNEALQRQKQIALGLSGVEKLELANSKALAAAKKAEGDAIKDATALNVAAKDSSILPCR